MGDQGGRVQLQLLSFDELFRPSREDSAKAIQKFRGFQKQNTFKGETRAKNELLTVLKQQRVLVDDRAIHFVAEARGRGRADARNSVFKLAQRYKVLPDTENVTKIRQLFGPVAEGDSGDEDWEPSFRRLPPSLKTSRGQKLMNDDEREILLKEINKIENESSALDNNVVTKEEVKEDPEYMIGRAVDSTAAIAHPSAAHERQQGGEHESDSDEDEEDDHFDAEDLKALNDMQKEFISNNLIAWMKDFRKAYESGVKLVKVNALGYKFIRILVIKDMVLSIRQPHTQSKVKVERQVAVTEVQNVQLGRDSKEFAALAKLVEQGKEPADNNVAELCATSFQAFAGHRYLITLWENGSRRRHQLIEHFSVRRRGKAATPAAYLCERKIPDSFAGGTLEENFTFNRLSEMHIGGSELCVLSKASVRAKFCLENAAERNLIEGKGDEDQRNGFVFYLRVISKKAKSAAAELGGA